MVVTELKKRAGAGRERSSEPSATMACGGAATAARERAEGRERKWRSANGSGGSGGRDRGLLVADQGVSTLPHARHAAARLCRRATAARRGRPRADAAWALALARGRGERGRAGPASASGPEVRPRPASAPFSLLYFFFEFPLSKSFLNSFGPSKNHFHLLLPKTKLFQNKNPTTLF